MVLPPDRVKTMNHLATSFISSIIATTVVHFSHLSPQRNIINFLTSTDVPTLHALLANPSPSARIFIALNNSNYLCKAHRTPHSRLHELDWWDEYLLRFKSVR
jgi:hypothetical protein